MALIKDFKLPSHAIANYHRVRRVEIDADQQIVIIWVAMYVNEDARLDNAQIIAEHAIRVPMSHFQDDVRRMAYALIHQCPNEFLFDAMDTVVPKTGPLDLTLVVPS